MQATLPTGHTIRPPRDADAEGVLAVLLARDVADIGRPDFSLDDLRADWSTPGVDLARDAWVVEDGSGAIAGSALLLGDDALIHVHPDACGAGIGTTLRERAEERARERGTAVLRQPIPAGNAGARALLLDAGYWPAQHYFRMVADLADVPPPATGPPIRTFERDRDDVAVHTLVQECLSEVEGYVAETLEVWRAQRITKQGWDPTLWLVLETDGGLEGVALGETWEGAVGYVAQIAVAPAARGRGHGRALLLELFAAFRRTGLRTAELSVHGSNRGAARLYESAGMRASWEAERWEKALGHD
jgi:ribosomal protein S18 acetylase RimI-like enzyme